MSSVSRARFINLAVAGYLMFGLAWLGLSDMFLAQGIFFVVATAVMFFLALRAVPRSAARSEQIHDAMSAGASGAFTGTRPRWLTCALAILLPLAMLAVRQHMAVAFGQRPLLILFILPVILSAMVGGAGPGLLATVVAALAIDYVIIPPLGRLETGSGVDAFQWLLFIVNGVIVSLLAEALHRAVRQAKTDRLLLRSVIQSTPDAVSVKDQQGRYVIVNPTITHALGMAADQILGRRADAFMPAAEAADLVSRDREVLDSRSPSVCEHTIQTTSGVRHYQTVRGPVIGPSQALKGVVTVSRDITAQRAASLALAQSEGRLRLALEALRDGIWDWDVATGQVFRSQRYLDLVGRDASEDTGDFAFFASVVDPEHLPRVRQAVDAHLNGLADGIDMDFRLNAPAGPERWLAARGRVVERGADGAPWRVVGTLSDVTETKRFERELESHRHELQRLVDERTAELVSARDLLAERERFLQTIADAVPALVGYWGADLNCRFGNKAYFQWFGKTPEAMIGLSLHSLLGAELFSSNEPYISGALRGQPQRFQRTLTLVDGSVGHTLVSYIPDCIGDEVRGFTAIVTDVSDLKRAELQLEQVNEQLAQRAAEAEDAARAKSAFLANMSHEIRTPMNAIIGLNHLLRRDATDGLQRDRLAKVDDAARHLLQVINDILDLSKIEAGKMTLERKEFGIDDVLERASAMVRARAAEKGLELIVDSDHLPSRVIGDQTRLSQVLINLLANAVKFTSTGWVRLRGMLSSQHQGRLQVRFEIQDTGPGISEEQQSKLFESFEQGDNSTTRLHGGTGLGLALTRRFAALMGGEAGVISAVGAGSTFWFTAELEPAEQDRAPQPGHTLQGLRALLVDDLPEAREALGDRLRMFGMDVESRHDGPSALALLSETAREGAAFDVMIVDWQMPGMDGQQVIHHARGAMAGGTPPAILVTAYDDQAMWAGAREAGVGGVLLKPVTATALTDCLAHVLRRTGAPQFIHSPDEAAARLQSHHRGRRILVAEDNPVNREIAVELLQSVGLVVETADDGQRAVELALAHDYALVLMDMQMPVRDGLDATREIRRQRGPRMPIVAMTANAFGEDQVACMDAGMDDHLAKPVDPDRLYRTLLKWLTSTDVTANATDDSPKPMAGEPGHASRRPLDERLALLPGYSLSRGLACIGGDVNRLVKVLKTFIATYRDGDAALLEAANQGDLAGVRTMAHAIRGACATVGAMAISELAEALEQEAAFSERDHESIKLMSQQLHLALQGLAQDVARELSQ